MTATVPGVCCKQEMICLLSAPNVPFPPCVKGTQGESSEVNGPFPQTVLLWNKVLPVKRHQLWCLFCFPPVGRSWDQVGGPGGGFANCSLSGSLEPSPPPDKSLHVHHWERES